IGDFRDLLIEKKLADQRHKNMEIAFLTFMGLFLAFCILAFISGMRQREYISFGVFSFVYSLLYFLDTSVFFDTGLKDHTIQKFIFFLTSLLAPCFLVFSIETFREKYNFFVKLIIFASFVLSFFFLITMEWKIYRIFVYAWTLMAFITGGLVIYNIIKSIIRRTYAAPELIVIISLLTFAGITWAGEVSGLFSTQRIIGFNMSEFAFPLAMILFLYTICAKFSKTLKELKVFSDRILSTHEIERKRISRDLHDSIGQSLSAIKLRLQMLNSKVSEEKTQEKDTYRALIDNISSSIEELRNIAMDIRPSFIETVDLSEALKLHGERFYKQTGIKLHLEVTSQSSKDLSTRIRDNLYRIYQESLNNISKHSEADNVWVSLKDEGDVIILMIEDNGKGFEPLTTCKGIGLETMKERASLLNGDLEIKSSLSKGTKIKVIVPLK
ncbi:MAG: sensor histidine kinase, partial [Syntrophorhabdaceae bacterium]|nr:sensor histidine kinase [Syntrophorhabdaceae bacterium]